MSKEKGPLQASQEQMWLDLHYLEDSKDEINGQPSTVLVSLWMALKTDQKFNIRLPVRANKR